MLRFSRTLALFFWYYLLFHSQALADEEATGELTPSGKNSPEEKSSFYSWFPSIPKLPSLPSFGLFGSSDGNNEEAVSTATAKGVTELIGVLQDYTGSGEGSNSEESQQTTTLTQRLFMSVAEIGTEPLPVGTSDLQHSSISQSNREAFVSPTSSFIRTTLFTDSPHRSKTPEQNTTHTPRSWRSTTVVMSSTGVTQTPLPDKESGYREAIIFTERISSTTPPETTVSTALTWKTAQTTTPNPGLVETAQTSTHLVGRVTLPTIAETNYFGEQEDLAVSVALHLSEGSSEIPPTRGNSILGVSETSLVNTEGSGVLSTTPRMNPTIVEGTISDIYPTQNHLDLDFSEKITVNAEQQSEVSPAAFRTDHNLIVEITTSEIHPTKSHFELDYSETIIPNTEQQPGVLPTKLRIDHNLEVDGTTSEMYHTQSHLDLGFFETGMNTKQDPGVLSSTLRKVLNLGVESTTPEIQTTQSHLGLGFSETSTVNAKQPGVFSTTLWVDHNLSGESIPSTTQSERTNFPIAEDLPGEEAKEKDEGVVTSATGGVADIHLTDTSTSSAQLLTTSTAQSTGVSSESPSILLYAEDWMSNLPSSDSTLLPDCNKERSGICNLSYTWDATPSLSMKPTQNITATNHSTNPFPIPATPMLVPLYTDWNSAMAAWGLAWEAHVYGAGGVFALLTLASALNLLCLPLRCPSGCGYFALVSLFLLAAGCTRSFSLLYDAYGHQDRISSTEASLMLYEAPFPCLTAAFGLVFLLLSMRSRMQLSYSAFQRPCFLACLVVLHFAAAFGPVTFFKFYQQKPPLCLFLSLISRGAFVVLATFLSAAYFVFYIYVRADSKHIYHLNNTSPTPAERYNRCPFAESRDWNRAALTVCLSALFSLACAGLQLYAMLNAMGVIGGEEVFNPWPWWAFQFSCRLCELGVCLTLALVVAQPVFCSDQLPAAGSCWTELLASKSPILPGTYQWTLSQQEKLAIVDTVGLGETENLPLYTLMDERLGSSLNGLDLLYHSNRALAYRDLDLDLGLLGSEKPEDGGGREPSGGSSFTSDSTTDLRPPSPINLRRSIDEALFSEALFPMSLFSPIRCSDTSVKDHWTLPSNGPCDPLSTDSSLYRTSSCLEMSSQPQFPPTQSQGVATDGVPASPSVGSSSSGSTPERWRGSSSSCSLYRASLAGSSLVLCPSSERHTQQLPQEGGSDVEPHNRPRSYQALGAASQESLSLSTETDRSVQQEFITVCRQMDSLSICSETIDL
ncbi:proline-rich transmembrane protein 4 [Fundulus heteroclitus]|uniref:proline-rich transmembrane protein 4 n=1 Tax=Fundulus heteroclitus TaxID=8078 RepID=UPI00165A19FC|nr:proline-rich transmembrane protein 4 [Fundulus heteroclitus]